MFYSFLFMFINFLFFVISRFFTQKFADIIKRKSFDTVKYLKKGKKLLLLDVDP